jgi:hypothetical protein
MTAEPAGAAVPTGPRRRGRRSRIVRAGAPLACAGLVATAATLGVQAVRQDHPAAAADPAPVSTAPVVRTDLVNTIQVSGALGYAGSCSVVNQATGTAYTSLPALGALVRRGQRLYEVDGSPVVLLYGARPAWRTLAPGIAPGADVAQLDASLIALGYGTGLTVSDYFTGATGYAVARWQQAAGLPVTGTVPLGQVVFAPGPLRITALTPALGAMPQPGATVLTATSPVLVATANLPVDQEYLVRDGDAVTVTLPDGVTTTPGVVTAISPVASAAPSSGGQATVPITVRLASSAGEGGGLDQAPVTVSIVSAQARGVLAVPVTALVALAGGGYAVDVVHGAGVRPVAVRTGLFASTLVQVSGPGLAPGQRVEVPSS